MKFVDKKQLLRPNLARIMVDVIPQIHALYLKHPSAPGNLKRDGTPVTSLDLDLSVLLENMTQEHFEGVTAYSEENYSEWKFPLMAIDPLDGTREYIRQRPEWAVSVGYLASESFEGEGWVYNPATKELYSNEQVKTQFVQKPVYYGEVSHSEWDRGLFRSFKSEKFNLVPMGSIAYKLGRLSAGKIDFVVSLAPKNIWDIAAGTLLCQQAGMKFYSQGAEVKEAKQLFQPPLIWCREEILQELLLSF